MNPALSITLASSEQILAAALMAMVVIVVASGSLALMLIARARFKRNLGRNPKKPKAIPDAWAEAGRRLDVPPDDLLTPRTSGPDDDPDDDEDNDDDDDDEEDDDDDDGDIEPKPSTPSSPEIAASL